MATFEAYGEDIINSPAVFPTDHSSTDYSTSEVMVGTWIDNSPLYQKTIDIGNLPTQAASKDIAHGISNLKTVINMFGMAQSLTTGQNIPIPRISYNAAYTVFLLSCDDTNVTVYSAFDATAFKGYITLQYTKTA